MLCVGDSLQIPLEEFDFTYARSGGPGGQNVNKVNSKAILRWPIVTSPSLPDDVKQRFLEKFASRITVEGEIVMSSQKYRDQARNVNECLDKLRAMIESVLKRPTPRRATKPSLAAKRRRVESKRETSHKKQSRRAPEIDD